MDKKIHVAYVINDVLFGGAQVAVLNIVKLLDAEFFEPVVYILNAYPDERPSLMSAYREAGVQLEYIGVEGKTGIGRNIFALKKRFKEKKPDIIHAHLNDAIFASIIAGRLSSVNHIIIHENNTHSMYSWKVRFLFILLRPLATLTVCYTPVLEEELFGKSMLLASDTNINELRGRRSCTILNGIDIEAIGTAKRVTDRKLKRNSLNISNEAVIVISIARLVAWKGESLLLEAFGLLAKKYPMAHLIFAGEGELKESLIARAKELELTERVHILGVRTDAFELLAVSDIAALSFLYKKGISGEAVGLAGLEAMAMGIPLIASDYPSAHRHIQDATSGLLVTPGDLNALALALEELIASDDKRILLGSQAADSIRRNLDWRLLVPIYERVYHLLVHP